MTNINASRARSTAGDTIVETLCAVLVCCLAIVVLTTAVVTSANIDVASKKAYETLTTERNISEVNDSSKAEYVSDGTTTVGGYSYNVVYYGGSTSSQYRYDESELRKAIISANAWMADNSSVHKTHDFSAVYRDYRNTNTIYTLTDDDLKLLFASYADKDPAHDGYNWSKVGGMGIYPSCIYDKTSGAMVDLIWIAGNPPGSDNYLRPIGFIYDGVVYGIFRNTGTGAPVVNPAHPDRFWGFWPSFYIGQYGPISNGLANNIRDGSWTVQDLIDLAYVIPTGGTY